MRTSISLAAVAAIALASCQTAKGPIVRPGAYRNPATGERLVFAGRTVSFGLRPLTGDSPFATPGYGERRFKYSLRSDGTLVAYPFASTEYARGVGMFRFRVQNDRIVQSARGSGEEVGIFVLQGTD